MKVIKRLSSRRNQSSKANTVIVPSIDKRLRVGRSLTGSFLFLAFTAFLIYGAAPAAKVTKATSSQPASSLHLQAASSTAPSNNQTTPDAVTTTPSANPAPKISNSSDNGSLSTNVTTTNGATTVTVNGQPVSTDGSGSINKTINTDTGSVQISVDQQGANNGGSVTLNSSSNSSGSSWDMNQENSFSN